MGKKLTVTIEEYANVDETFQNIKNIKVGSMTLNDLFGDNLKVIENALEERKELLKWKDSQKDLINGKDEYIARLCNDRAELKDKLNDYEIQNTILKEHEKELIAEQHRLFDLAKEQENELKELKEFARIVSQKQVDIAMLKGLDNEKQYNAKIRINCNFNNYDIYMLTQAEFALVKKVVEKYGQEKQ